MPYDIKKDRWKPEPAWPPKGMWTPSENCQHSNKPCQGTAYGKEEPCNICGMFENGSYD